MQHPIAISYFPPRTTARCFLGCPVRGMCVSGFRHPEDIHPRCFQTHAHLTSGPASPPVLSQSFFSGGRCQFPKMLIMLPWCQRLHLLTAHVWIAFANHRQHPPALRVLNLGAGWAAAPNCGCHAVRQAKYETTALMFLCLYVKLERRGLVLGLPQRITHSHRDVCCQHVRCPLGSHVYILHCCVLPALFRVFALRSDLALEGSVVQCPPPWPSL